MSARGDEPGLLRRLQGCLDEPLGPGALAVIMAGPGVGKTSFLVQAGLDEALAGRDVLHLSMGVALEQAQAYYEALLADRCEFGGPACDREAVRAELVRRRMLRVLPRGALRAEQLVESVDTLGASLALAPQVALLDGDDWQAAPDELAARLEGLKAAARVRGLNLWACVNTPEARPGEVELPPPVAAVLACVDLAAWLVPEGDRVVARVVAAAGRPRAPWDAVELEPDTLLPRAAGRASGSSPLEPSSCVLLSGGADGIEAEFGALAEAWGVAERHYTFPGRKTARQRGLRLLSPDELRQGDVSWTYLKAHMHREYKRTAEFRKVLQTIWYQVNATGEVFAVGVIQPDDTVRGGTGWAVQLAKHLHKPVSVYDQQQRAWYRWNSGQWRAIEPPTVRRRLFTGTGTRQPNQDARRALRELFERSFGPLPTNGARQPAGG
jgi:hypothetical protein